MSAGLYLAKNLMEAYLYLIPGLPNAFGGYDETPEYTASKLKVYIVFSFHLVVARSSFKTLKGSFI